MRRADRLAVVAVLALISARAHADDEPGPTPVIAATTTPVTGREAIAAALAAQAETISRTLGTLATKLHAADATRAARARAAYRVLAAPLAADASLEDRLIAARRRAGVRLLLARDLGERALLADEAGHLEDAARRTVAATARARELTLPLHLAWPARGTIARHVGVLIHERSKATLARRGLDLDVDDRAPARAAADGVVRYAGPIRGLDAGVIIAHGDYLTVTAKLAGLEVAAGDEVHVGDRLGHAAKHRVYFEVRARAGAGGLPIDPEPLLGDR